MRAFAVVAYAVARIPGVGDAFVVITPQCPQCCVDERPFHRRGTAPCVSDTLRENLNKSSRLAPDRFASFDKGADAFLRVLGHGIHRHDLLRISVRCALGHFDL